MSWRWEQVDRWLDKPLMGAEIGVKEGRFITHLLTVFPDLKMYAVDPWENQPNHNEDYIGWNWNTIYNEYQQRTKKMRDRVIELREFSETAASKVPDKSLDFVFIDAQHDYYSVKKDIELWEPKVKPGGLLCGHDYEPNFPGVIQAVDEVFNAKIGANAVWGVQI